MIKCLAICLLLFSYEYSAAQVIINGTIKNYDGKSKVYYSPTLDGILLSSGPSREVVPSSNGNFRIKFENRGIGTTRLIFDKLIFSFFHNEQSKIELVIDQAKIKFPKLTMEERLNYDWSNHNHMMDSIKQNAIQYIGGDFAEINQFYNSNVRSSMLTFLVQGNDFSIQLRNAPSPTRVKFIMDSLIQIELAQIDKLDEQITLEGSGPEKRMSEIKEFLTNEVYAFYGSVFLNGMFLKRKDQVQQLTDNPYAPLSIYNKAWEHLIEDFFRNSSRRITPAPNSYSYNEFLRNAKLTLEDYKEYVYNLDLNIDNEIVAELIESNFSELDSTLLLDDKAIFSYQLQVLSRYLYEQTSYSPILVRAIDKLKAEHPNSQHLQQFEPIIDKVEEYVKTVSEHYDGAKYIETNYVHFSDLLETLKGKNIFIDVWATWCGPCIEDFDYKSTLKPFIDNEDLVVLYVSIDKLSWEKRWKRNISYHQLKGYHVLGNEALIQDMWNFLKGPEGVIPRYALIDKSGNIFRSEAARPRHPEKLVEEIELLIVSSKE